MIASWAKRKSHSCENSVFDVRSNAWASGRDWQTRSRLERLEGLQQAGVLVQK